MFRMPGLKIAVCFWYVDSSVAEEVLAVLRGGQFEVDSCMVRDEQMLQKHLDQSLPDLIISDFDLPDQLRAMIEARLEPYFSEIPLIYLVGTKNEKNAARTLRSGVWDYVSKEQLYKLVSSVYGAIRYAREAGKRKEAEEALTQSRDRYHTIFHGVTDGILMLDSESMEVIEYNQQVLGILEMNDEDLMSSDIGILSCESEGYSIELTRRYLKDSEGKNQPVYFEWRFKKKDGTLVWTFNSISIIATGKDRSVLLVIRDIDTRKKAQEALLKSEERLNLALRATGLGLWDLNLQDYSVYLSPLWFSMLGYGPDELPHHSDTWMSLIHPEDLDGALDVLKRCAENNDESFVHEYRLKHKQGHYLWVLNRGKVVGVDEDERPIRISGIHENIHARKREEMVRQIVFDIANATNGALNLDELYERLRESLSKVLDTTNCFLALYDESKDSISLPFMHDQRDSKEAVHTFPARKTLTSYVLRTGKAQLLSKEELKELAELGEIEWQGTPSVSWLGVPLQNEGRTIGVFAVQSYSEDVIYTQEDAELLAFASNQMAIAIDRKRDQDMIRRNQAMQSRVFESSPDPMIVVDTEGRFKVFNTAFLDTFQMQPEEASGKSVFDFLDPVQKSRIGKEIAKTWEKGYFKNHEYKLTRLNGSTFSAELSGGAIYSPEGENELMVLIVKNIEDWKEAERRLFEAKDKAEESDRLKTAFLSNMSHEIRTPMNAIVGFSDLLADETISIEERRDYIAQINQGAENLMRLIDDIIDIAKIEAGQLSIHIAEAYIRDLFKELQLMFTQSIQRTGKPEVNLEINWEWPEAELDIYTDVFRLKQILINLMGNALKFTEKGKVVLGLREDPKGVRFYVKDSGIGIRKEKQEVIFARFMQGHSNKTKLYGGAGLGLAISKHLAELLKGQIGVDSEPGKGSTFWLILPLQEVPVKREALIRPVSSDMRSWKGKKLLIAEDDHSNYFFLYESLKDTGLDILWTRDGEETIEVFRETPDLDIVLMDIQMPGMNGHECTRIIKKERPDLPVVAQTAYALAGEEGICREAGCDDYLAKPIKVSALLSAIARFI